MSSISGCLSAVGACRGYGDGTRGRSGKPLSAWRYTVSSAHTTLPRPDGICPQLTATALRASSSGLAAGGVSKVEPAFEDFRRLFLYAHLEAQYSGRAWVVVDGDASGLKVAEELRKTYKTWSPEHFHAWSETDFERYYPSRFADRVSEVLALPRDKKRDAKKILLDEVTAWCDSNEEEAKVQFHESAQEVVAYLKVINDSLQSQA